MSALVTFTLRPKRSRPIRRVPLQPVTAPRRGDRGARMLALAHRIERAIEAGEITDYAAVATLLGITRARVSQIVALTTLAPDLQAALLTGTVFHERDIRVALRSTDWQQQRAALGMET